jgi:hypothetical protein
MSFLIQGQALVKGIDHCSSHNLRHDFPIISRIHVEASIEKVDVVSSRTTLALHGRSRYTCQALA